MSDVTASGNEITDASRLLALEGDGIDASAKRDGSFGVWEATTNLITNGGLESNLTGWTESGSTHARDTGESKFGDASGEITPDDGAANEGVYHAFAGAAATKYTVSVWVWGTGTARIALYDDVTGKQACTAVTLSATPQRITKTATTGGGSATFRLYVETGVQQGGVVNFDGAQAEAQPIATPYVETDGATVSRTVARVRIPASLLDETQGWLAIRVRLNYASTGMPIANPWAWLWADDANNRLGVYFSSSLAYMMRRNTGGTGQITQAHGGFAKGDHMLILAAWTATHLYISTDGANFASIAKANTPTLSAALLDLASATAVWASYEFDVDILWAAMGTGVLTDADSAAIALLGDGAYPCDFPAAALVTACWNADDASYHEPEEDVRAAELAASVR